MNTPGNSTADLALIRQGLLITESFAGWPPAAIDALLPVAHLGRYERGALVRSEVDGRPEVLIILSGHLVASRIYPDGSRAPVFIFNPGFVAGIQQALDTEVHVFYSYEAHDSAVVLHLPAQVVIDRLDAQPSLWREMARVVVKHHRSIANTLLDYQTGSTRQRLAATIARLAQIHGVDDDTQSLRLRLSQDDLATMLQVTRQSINREMRTLEDMGLIRAEYGAVSVFKLQVLRQLGGNAAGADPLMALGD